MSAVTRRGPRLAGGGAGSAGQVLRRRAVLRRGSAAGGQPRSPGGGRRPDRRPPRLVSQRARRGEGDDRPEDRPLGRGARRDRGADGRPRAAAQVRSRGRARGPRSVRASPGAEHGAEASGDRRDLRSLPTFTVDPLTARDFDDAISAAAQDDGARRVWVHIADVSAYVRPGSLLDREAYRRGTSVYVPGAVEPMLPEALSNRRLLARARAGSTRGHGRDRARRRPRPQQRVLPLGDPLRRAARLRARRPHLRRPVPRRRWLGAGARGRARGGGRARGTARPRRRRCRSSPPSPSSSSTIGATSCPPSRSSRPSPTG